MSAEDAICEHGNINEMSSSSIALVLEDCRLTISSPIIIISIVRPTHSSQCSSIISYPGPPLQAVHFKVGLSMDLHFRYPVLGIRDRRDTRVSQTLRLVRLRLRTILQLSSSTCRLLPARVCLEGKAAAVVGAGSRAASEGMHISIVVMNHHHGPFMCSSTVVRRCQPRRRLRHTRCSHVLCGGTVLPRIILPVRPPTTHCTNNNNRKSSKKRHGASLDEQ